MATGNFYRLIHPFAQKNYPGVPILSETRLSVFQFLEQTLYAVFLLDRSELILERVVFQYAVRGSVRRFLLQYARAKPIESHRFVLHSGDRPGAVGFADRARSPVLCDQHLAGGLGLQQFLLQLREGIA